MDTHLVSDGTLSENIWDVNKNNPSCAASV
jgi:hypothetical protein